LLKSIQTGGAGTLQEQDLVSSAIVIDLFGSSKTNEIHPMVDRILTVNRLVFFAKEGRAAQFRE